MFKRIALVAVAVGVVAACQPRQPEIVPTTAPLPTVQAEQTFPGKY